MSERRTPCPSCGLYKGHAGKKMRQRRKLLATHRERQGNRCYWCDCVMSDQHNALEQATLEHLMLVSEGGEDTEANTRAACMRCNSSRHTIHRSEKIIAAWEALAA